MTLRFPKRAVRIQTNHVLNVYNEKIELSEREGETDVIGRVRDASRRHRARVYRPSRVARTRSITYTGAVRA